MKVKEELFEQIFSSWVTYDVDCDDGTSGDVIYEFKSKKELPF